MPASRSSTTVCCSVVVGRKEIVVVPRESRRICSAPSGCTETTTSAPSNAAASTVAPASAYSSSASSAGLPAPGSTATSYPRPVSLPTSSGTSATRASPSRVSFATAIFIRGPRGVVRRRSGARQEKKVVGVSSRGRTEGTRPGSHTGPRSPRCGVVHRPPLDSPRRSCRSGTLRPRQERRGLSGEPEIVHSLVAGAAAGSFTEVRRDEGEAVDGPGGSAVGVEQLDPGGDVLGMTEPGDGQVRSEALGVDGDAGPARGGPRAGRHPGQLDAPPVRQVQAGPQHRGAGDVRERTTTGDRRLEEGTACAG